MEKIEDDFMVSLQRIAEEFEINSEIRKQTNGKIRQMIEDL